MKAAKIFILNVIANAKLRKCDVSGFNKIIDKIRKEMYGEIFHD